MNLRAFSVFFENGRHGIGRRRGFTMIELLIVIGILLILISLFTLGANYVTGQLKIKSTKNTLETAKQLWANYVQAGGLQKPLPNTPNFQPPSGMANDYASLMNGAEQSPAGNITPNALNLTSSSRAQTYPFGLPIQVANTELIMSVLMAFPENQNLVNNLPANQRIRDATTGCTLLLDAWGNPILFVPAGGLQNMWVDPGAGVEQEVTSGGVQPNGQAAPVNAQPFWVSAGPDGDISNAHGWTGTTTAGNSNANGMTDDNIYSFKN